MQNGNAYARHCAVRHSHTRTLIRGVMVTACFKCCCCWHVCSLIIFCPRCKVIGFIIQMPMSLRLKCAAARLGKSNYFGFFWWVCKCICERAYHVYANAWITHFSYFFLRLILASMHAKIASHELCVKVFSVCERVSACSRSLYFIGFFSSSYLPFYLVCNTNLSQTLLCASHPTLDESCNGRGEGPNGDGWKVKKNLFDPFYFVPFYLICAFFRSKSKWPTLCKLHKLNYIYFSLPRSSSTLQLFSSGYHPTRSILYR